MLRQPRVYALRPSPKALRPLEPSVDFVLCSISALRPRDTWCMLQHTCLGSPNLSFRFFDAHARCLTSVMHFRSMHWHLPDVWYACVNRVNRVLLWRWQDCKNEILNVCRLTWLVRQTIPVTWLDLTYLTNNFVTCAELPMLLWRIVRMRYAIHMCGIPDAIVRMRYWKYTGYWKCLSADHMWCGISLQCVSLMLLKKCLDCHNIMTNMRYE